jgi:hypothetical protein
MRPTLEAVIVNAVVPALTMTKGRQTRRLTDGTPAHSFCRLLEELATIVRNTCRVPYSAETLPTFAMVTTPNDLQRRARELIDQISA